MEKFSKVCGVKVSLSVNFKVKVVKIQLQLNKTFDHFFINLYKIITSSLLNLKDVQIHKTDAHKS